MVVALPYANPLVHFAAWAAPERVIFWPCLHDEPYAYLEPVRLLMDTAWGIMFNTPEEQMLAAETLGFTMPRQAVVGVGISFEPLLDRHEERNGLLYVGRLEEGKNVPQLYQYVTAYVRRGSCCSSRCGRFGANLSSATPSVRLQAVPQRK